MSCPATSSGVKSSDGVIYDKPCRLLSVKLVADGTNAAEAELHDNASAASGLVVAKASVAAGSTESSDHGGIPDGGVVCNNGIYLNITGTNAECIVYFSPGV